VSDRTSLGAVAFLRAFATGQIGVLLAIHIAANGLDAGAIGAVVAAGLAGAALAALIVTVAGERIGRRRALVALSFLGAAGGTLVAFAEGAVPLAAAAFLGMVNGMGRDRGAALILDQAILPGLVSDHRRTDAFAVYNVLQDVGHALGALAAGLPALLRRLDGVDEIESLRIAVLGYAAVLLATAVVYRGLSPAVETHRGKVRISPESRRIVARISALFALDSFGGGFLSSALLAYFFHERFGVDVVELGALFFAARLANAASHIGAARLARRFGLVRTMVFTHIPSSLLLLTVAIAPSFPVAALLFLLREGLVEMDVPTRQSYVMAVVAPEERTFASGVTHLVRLGGWALAPAIAGALMEGASLAIPLVIGAGLKIAYDLLLWRAFRGIQPPEER